MLVPAPWHRPCFIPACILFSVEESPSPQWSRITSQCSLSPQAKCGSVSVLTTWLCSVHCYLLKDTQMPPSPQKDLRLFRSPEIWCFNFVFWAPSSCQIIEAIIIILMICGTSLKGNIKAELEECC